MMRSILFAIGVSFAFVGSLVHAADTYPDHQIRLLVPSSAGGGADFLARILSPRLSQILGQTVVVENKSGASGTIAGNMVAKANPDGYTITMAQSTSIVSAPYMYDQLPYNPLKDFAPVSLVALVPNILVVNPKSGIKSVADLIALAKAKPGQVTYGSAGFGAPSHLAGRMLEKMGGVKLLHVPYKGSGPAVTALMSGQIDLMFASLTSVLPMVENKQLVALGATTAARMPSLPDVPTIAEAGLPGYDINSWFGLFVPAATPANVVNRLHKAVVLALEDPQVSEAVKNQGAEAVGGTPAEFARFVQVENEKTAGLIAGLDPKGN